MSIPARAVAASAVAALLVLVPASPAGADPAPSGSAHAGSWVWPGGVAAVVRPWEAPAHDYGPGHRGVDVAVADPSSVVAPDDGVVAFVGTVVDRPLVTIDHGGGLVSTIEPVASDLSPGDRVARGGVVGALASGGHTAPGALHLGVRRDGEYIDPLALLGARERPVLLPV
ncbi:murein hydrolase activator EnvC family protein [Microbacterium indicum]|uniref:murein hydrolase activator EnvC family protein n=1 Tax=Microbacterium indicum TaxID=358100 RepID=UPI000400FBEA|nr:M23 family metallopeptidase [Microbacterium indicum]